MKKKILTIICLLIAAGSVFYLILETIATLRYGGQMERIIPRLAYDFWGQSHDPCVLYGCPDPNYKPYDDECAAADFSAVNFSLKRIVYVVRLGDNLWNVLDFNLKQQQLVQKIDYQDANTVLDYIEKRIGDMTPEEIKNIGISSGNINILTPGDKINISPYILDTDQFLKKTGINLFEFKSSNLYMKNGRYVCWSNKLVPGADSDSFIAFDNLAGQDKNQVYFNGYFVEGMDPNSLEFLNGAYLKDEHDVYYDDGINLSKLDGADGRTFEYWKGIYYKDSHNVFSFRDKLGGINPDESVILNDAGTYLRFRNLIYAGPWRIAEADANTFQILENDYSKDDKSVFYGNRRVYGADSYSFHVVKALDHDAEDKFKVYWGGFPGPRNSPQ